jgi:hypothetical protein
MSPYDMDKAFHRRHRGGWLRGAFGNSGHSHGSSGFRQNGQYGINFPRARVHVNWLDCEIRSAPEVNWIRETRKHSCIGSVIAATSPNLLLPVVLMKDKIRYLS